MPKLHRMVQEEEEEEFLSPISPNQHETTEPESRVVACSTCHRMCRLFRFAVGPCPGKCVVVHSMVGHSDDDAGTASLLPFVQFGRPSACANLIVNWCKRCKEGENAGKCHGMTTNGPTNEINNKQIKSEHKGSDLSKTKNGVIEL